MGRTHLKSAEGGRASVLEEVCGTLAHEHPSGVPLYKLPEIFENYMIEICSTVRVVRIWMIFTDAVFVPPGQKGLRKLELQ